MRILIPLILASIITSALLLAPVSVFAQTNAPDRVFDVYVTTVDHATDQAVFAIHWKGTLTGGIPRAPGKHAWTLTPIGGAASNEKVKSDARMALHKSFVHTWTVNDKHVVTLGKMSGVSLELEVLTRVWTAAHLFTYAGFNDLPAGFPRAGATSAVNHWDNFIQKNVVLTLGVEDSKGPDPAAKGPSRAVVVSGQGSDTSDPDVQRTVAYAFRIVFANIGQGRYRLAGGSGVIATVYGALQVETRLAFYDASLTSDKARRAALATFEADRKKSNDAPLT